MTSLQDRDIITRIRSGQLDYFSEIVNRYTRPILIYVTHRLFDKNDAEDLVQNIFLNFYKYINKFDINQPLLPYLYGIAKNEIKMYIRSKKVTFPLNESTTADDTVEKIEIESIIQSLPENQRKPLQWLYEGYTYEEIAKKLKKPVNTIKTQIRRIRLKHKNYEKT